MRFEHLTVKEYKFYFPEIFKQLVVMNSPEMNTLEIFEKVCGDFLKTEATPGMVVIFIQFANHSIVLTLSHDIAGERQVISHEHAFMYSTPNPFDDVDTKYFLELDNFEWAKQITWQEGRKRKKKKRLTLDQLVIKFNSTFS